jgi:anaphase-promoting complex subunit 10
METLGLVDIGALGSWSVSSNKTGSGVKELRDDSPHTYWQSDGTQPHHLDIHFSKRVSVSRLSIYTDYLLDESYTPSNIVVLAGHGFHDLLEVVTLDLHKPSGWTHVEFDKIDGLENSLKTFLIRLLIVANHQYGKDTHLRAVKLYSPMTVFSMDTSVLGPFTSSKLLTESTIR